MASFYFANRRSRILHGDTPSSSNNLIMDEFHSRPVILNGATSKVKVGYIGYTKIAPPILEQEKPVGSLLIERRVPVKVEPKVFLANERTFLAWMHSSLWLFGASITILKYSFGDPLKIMYGAMIMLVALVFIFYSIFQFVRRADMLKKKAPGPYEDKVGPVLYALLLMVAIIAQFFIKLRPYEYSF